MATRKTTGKKNNKKQEKTQEAGFFGSEIAIILSFLVSLLLFLSNFGLCGKVGEGIKNVQLGFFGLVGYLFPVILFVTILFIASNRENPRAWLKVIAVVFAMISLTAIIEILFPGVTDTPGDGYLGGGILGEAIAKLFSSFGTLGSILIMLAIFIISVVYITEKSFVNAVKRGGGKVYAHAREDAGRLREEHAERREEREEARRRKLEQKVTGIDFASTDLSRNDPLQDPLRKELAQSVSEIRMKEEDSFKTPADEKEPVSADVFRGRIQLPNHTDEEEVPFDSDAVTEAYRRADTILTQNAADMSQRIAGVRTPDPTADFDVPISGLTGDNDGFPGSAAEESFAQADKRTAFGEEYSGQTDSGQTVSRQTHAGQTSPEDTASGDDTALQTQAGTRTIVTSTGKIIHSEVDEVHKRMTQAQKNSEVGQVREQIAEKKHREKPYRIPPMHLLTKGEKKTYSDKEFKETAIKLQQTLRTFGIAVTVNNISCGPAVTRYEMTPEVGVRVGRILSLQDDLKMALAAADIRIEAPIPGKAAIGIEVPNSENTMVCLRDLLESKEYKGSSAKVAFALGKDLTGTPVVTDVAKMPHLLIAGATGSGKSVCINTLILSLLYKYSPKDLKLLMVDPKVVELSVFNGIPHLLIPVVTDPKKAAGALNWAVAEMEDRYKKFEAIGAKDIESYNAKIEAADVSLDGETEELPEKMPRIVIIVDELADLMMVAKNDVETAIVRLTQLARAAGMHVVIATQRPSVNVITGLIKANIPSRIAFMVSSGVDSRTILDQVGAERLLGKGDMLFSPQGAPKPARIQGAFVSEAEITSVVDYIKKEDLGVSYSDETITRISAGTTSDSSPADDRDDLFVQAGRFIIDKKKASIGNLQRAFRIGFNRAARIMDQLCDAGVVGEEQGTKPREVLMTIEEFEELTRG